MTLFAGLLLIWLGIAILMSLALRSHGVAARDLEALGHRGEDGAA